jgi:hypothetical protein
MGGYATIEENIFAERTIRKKRTRKEPKQKRTKQPP